jgi:5-oxoprolinase (ATP-hydrolysing)
MKHWKIWIDTGGTFTDCLAIDPIGNEIRLKVLSNSVLRGRVIEVTGSKTLKIKEQWQVKADIFESYQLRFPSFVHFGVYQVKYTHLAKGEITLFEDLSHKIEAGTEFEITANEEAPVLAMRLATRSRYEDPLPPAHLRLGFTKGTNALLEKNGADVALLVTKGFADLPIIGTQQRPHLFQLDIPDPWLPFKKVVEVTERLMSDGQVLTELTDEEINKVISVLKNAGCSSVAISFLHAYKNTSHEEKMEKALLEAGFSYVSRSSSLSLALKWLPRMQTTLIDAYLNPLIISYLNDIEKTLQNGSNESTLQIMTSDGALVPLSLFHPKDSLLSGPAGGIVGAATLAKQSGFNKTLTLDMGGTSTDTAIYDGRFDYRYNTKLDGLELQSTVLAIETVAAGGGSICYFENGGLQVGPKSAGAFPGPACYGAGGPLTLSDVNILLGKMDASCFSIPIFPEKANEMFLKLLNEIDAFYGTKHNPVEILKGLERIGNEKMADAIRSISLAKGFNPSDYPLLAFGGAGGLHACAIAELLSINKILIPYDAGILSAFGIGKAKIERYAEREIRMPLDLADAFSSSVVAELTSRCEKDLFLAGIFPEDTDAPQIYYFLRFSGQESSLEVQASSFKDVSRVFQQEYKKIFGYSPTDRPIELVKIMVRLTTIDTEFAKVNEKLTAYFPKEKHFSKSNNLNVPYPVFFRDDLEAGATFYGPAILLMPTSTAFIQEYWQCCIDKNGMAILTKTGKEKGVDPLTTASVALTLFTNRFKSIAEEMGVQLQRTAFSVNVKERLDFSCALVDPNGFLLVNAPHIPVHLGSLGICIRLVTAKMPLQEGDVIVTNHPAFGGSHLPDITLIQGVFTEHSELIGYVINRAHHAEIGGKTPGSMPPDARFLFEEGVVISPFYLAKNGIWFWDEFIHKLENATYPTRSLSENIADIHAGIASLQYGVQALRKLTHQYGLDTVHSYMEKVQDFAHQQLFPVLNKVVQEPLFAHELLDDGIAIKLKISKEKDLIHFDFRGTEGPHPHNLNANISIVYSTILYVLRLLCPGDLPLNEGLLRGIKIILPETSLLHPLFSENENECPAVVGGNTEVSQRLTDTLIKAFGLAACSQGTMNNFLFGNESFGYYETIGGGTGATGNHHGRSAVHQHMTNTRLTDLEELEFRYPVRMKKFEIRKGSGGLGKHHGGDGIIREIQFLLPLSVTFISQHRIIPPYGMSGGENGKCGEQSFIFPDGKKEVLPGIFNRKIETGTIFHLETPGGGGFGSV